LSYNDAEGARNWVSKLQEGEARANAVVAVVEGSANKDPNGTAIWLNQFTPTDAYDEALRKFALAITEIDPQAARDWASSIVDNRSREYWQVVVASDLRFRHSAFRISDSILFGYSLTPPHAHPILARFVGA
jgi:hypothetical protein